MAMSTLSGKRQRTTDSDSSVGGIVATTPQLVHHEDDDEPPQVQHPLMNDVILKNMFQYLGRKELNNCRLVCRHWEQISFPLWLKDDPPVRLENVCWKYDKADRKKLETFVGEFHLLRQGLSRSSDGAGMMTTQFHKFTKFDIMLHAGALGVQYIFKSFYKQCGNWMTHLELNVNCWYKNMSRILVQDVLSCRYTPNLETLWLTLSLTNDVWWNDSDSVSDDGFQGENNKTLKSFKLIGGIQDFKWKVLLNHFPALEELTLAPTKPTTAHESHYTLDQLQTVLTVIRDIRLEDNKKLQLKSLSWCDLSWSKYSPVTSEEDFPNLVEVRQLLGELRLDLDTLGIYLNANADHRAVGQVFKMYAKSLKQLSIYRESPMSNSPFTGMELEKLQILNVGGDVFQDLLFLNDLPNLRALRLTRCLPPGRSIFNARGSNDDAVVFPSISITQFSCDWMNVDWNEADINRMRDLMPNLTSLEMRLDNATFRRVCENFPNLVTLTVLGSDLGDEGIVGLTMEDDDDGSGVSFRTPNITNLQQLRRFVMHDEIFSRGEDVITKHSVNEGFLKLARLETLSIRVVSNRMDPNARRTLRRKIPFAKLVIWRKWSNY